MRAIPLSEAQEHLSDLIDAALAGETIILVTEDSRAIQLTPTRFGQGQPTFGSGKGLFMIADDFDAPIEEFDGLAT